MESVRSGPSVPEDLRDWAGDGAFIGDPEGVSAVWALSDGAVLKRYGSHRAWVQATHALRCWAPHIGVAVPRVLRSHEALRAVVLSGVPGRALEDEPGGSTRAGPRGAPGAGASGAPGASPSDEGRRALRALGAAVRRLHELQAQPDAMPLSEALSMRWRAAAGPAGLARVAFEPELFEGTSRVPCHRDLRRRNLLWQAGPGGGLGLLDWEHARPDAAELDLARVAPADRPAFLGGYGAVDPQRMEQADLLHAAVSLAWGRRHGDERWVREGQATLQRLGLAGGGRSPG